MILRFCKKFWPALAALAGLALSLLCAPGARSDSWPRPLWPTFPPRNEMAAIEEGTSFLHEAHFTYAIDRSALPDWVTLRIVTLLVEVGPALDVVALGDGEPVPCRHDGRYAIVTTDASRVEVIVSGHTWPFSEMGGVRVATLRDNKAWALSLTLDDGYTSQATTAKSLLDRYGYDATIAVIGGRIGQTFYGKDYASAEQLRDVVAAGWHLANHSYSHRKMSEMGGEAEALRDIQRANEAIMAAVPGYRPIVFTSPEADPAFEPVIKNHVDTLGFHLLQSRNWEGMVVDPELFVADDWQPTTLGRTQLLYDGSQFDQAHRWAEEHSGQHLWLSLHTHHVVEACDCVETATDILYRTYGAGGSDEVWVAPAPEVYQYLLTRDRVRVTELERYTVGTPSPSWQLPTPTPTPEVYALVLKQGRAGYAGTRDADIDSYAPTTNDGAGGSLTVRTLELKSALIAFALDRLPQDAVVQEAQLRLYGVDGTNEAVICLETYPLLREWQEREVTWLQAANGQPWAAPGAAAPGLDRTAKHSGLRGLVEGGGHWYTLDVTDAVRRWATGELANHGWLLKGSNNAAKQINLASSEYGDAALRPELYITYTLPPPIEEPTAPPGDGLLVGRALFSGLTPPASWSAPITVTLRRADDGSLAYRQVTTADAEGGFVLAALQPDLYDLELSSKGALPAVRCRLSIRSGLNLATVGPLALGDIVPDGYISARDWISLTQGLGTIAGQARYLPQADLNGDERVDLRDVAILSANYGR
ncbi:MAG: DNRLRE domain-containing protein, partial [Chloroflexi bacterium]|nr:DNRLRE domain-containing protein [Chloroflexota bacterium]